MWEGWAFPVLKAVALSRRCKVRLSRARTSACSSNLMYRRRMPPWDIFTTRSHRASTCKASLAVYKTCLKCSCLEALVVAAVFGVAAVLSRSEWMEGQSTEEMKVLPSWYAWKVRNMPEPGKGPGWSGEQVGSFLHLLGRKTNKGTTQEQHYSSKVGSKAKLGIS